MAAAAGAGAGAVSTASKLVQVPQDAFIEIISNLDWCDLAALGVNKELRHIIAAANAAELTFIKTFIDQIIAKLAKANYEDQKVKLKTISESIPQNVVKLIAFKGTILAAQTQLIHVIKTLFLGTLIQIEHLPPPRFMRNIFKITDLERQSMLGEDNPAAFSLEPIEVGFAKLGLADRAVLEVQKIADNFRKNSALAKVCFELACNNYTKQSIEVSRLISDQAVKDNVFQQICTALVLYGEADQSLRKVRDIDEALVFARLIVDEKKKAATLSSIYQALIWVGDVRKAWAVAQEAAGKYQQQLVPFTQALVTGDVNKPCKHQN